MKNLTNISLFKIILTIMVLLLMITSCGDQDKENEGNHLPDVHITKTDKSVLVGENVTLSSIILDIDGDELTYKWSFASKPARSNAILTTDTSRKSSFIPDEEGIYKVKLIAKDTFDAIGSDTFSITATKENENRKIVMLYHDKCPPCLSVKPRWEELKKRYSYISFEEINILNNSSATEKYNVSNIPLFVLEIDGKEVARDVGQTEGTIEKLILMEIEKK